MTRIWILNDKGKKQTILSSVKKGACRFYDAPFREELNVGSSFSFVVDADHDDCKFVREENSAVFRDRNGTKREFIIKELEDVDDGANPLIRVYCEPAIAELYDEFVTDIRPQDKTAQYVLDRVLEGTRWSGKVTAELGLNSTNFYRISVMEAVNKILQVWGGELYDEVVFDENDNIVDRIVHILPRRGKDTGKRFTIDKDIEEIQRTVLSYPKTAFYGYGASLETEGGGNTRYIDFSEVEWSVANGDPVDKPKGQEWVGDPDLLDKFGRPMYDGTTKRHRFGEWNDDTIQDAAELLRKTYEALINHVNVQVNYSLKVKLLERIAGYEHEKVELGDTTVAIDRKFKRPIELQSRVIAFEYDIADPDNTGQVEMGQFLDLDSTEKRIGDLENIIDTNRGKWDNGGNPVVGDGSFPDITPPVPTNVKIESLFQGVAISWDYDPSSYIAAYEVYASPNKGFTPLPENRIFYGKGNMCEHSPGVDQVWYYRLRSMNTHKKYSDFTEEFTGITQRIMTDDILFGSITADLLANLAIKADKISRDFEDANILPGSILNAPDLYVVNAKRSVNYSANGFNEVTVTKNSTSYSYFGITTRGRPTLSLTKDQVYTLSFELKRLTTKDFSYLRLLTESGASYDIPNSLSDISGHPTDEFVRFDVVFTAPATFSDGRIGIGGRTVNNGDSAEFVLRKLQIRRGDVRKEFGFSPYDTQLTDGVITSQYVQDAAIVSAKIADAAITSAKIAEAAVGSAAIQNAAIKRAHLETAIIGTAQIEDGAITNAKIANLSADKINAGTIKGITIEGSLIRGARFEAAGQNENFESWIQDGTFYQWTKNANTDEYNELTITSGMLKQETGKLDYNEKRERYTTIEMGNGKLSIYGTPSVGQTYASPIIDMYSETSVKDNSDYEFTEGEAGRFRMWEKGADVIDAKGLYSITTGGYYAAKDRLYEGEYGTFHPSIYLARFDGSDSMFRFKPQNFDVVASAGLRLKAEKRMLLDSPEVILSAGTKIVAGNNTPHPPYSPCVASIRSSITDTYGGLQYSMGLLVDEFNMTLPMNGGSYGYTSTNYTIYGDGNLNKIENVFAVFAQAYGPYSSAVTVGVENQSSSGFKVYMRGTGSTAGIESQTITVRLLICYEAA
ncbi:prophage endopeptidase tail family protein [Bacillus sonorensis]|uniref:prophage endopeptidase tail family protein n=1 Tax=Bacillus sonorensis TaxID=119858 RepID=UPI00227E1288|nr:prophage endopeptidase tail family protein [Bacillus sonorensis]MCY8035646.1 phage tail protein [Bacillus sonorensis]MCY8563707.1 phage tail protein [Bacillus sonorensis]